MYPLDLPSVDDGELTSASLKYLSSLESGSASKDWFHLSTTSKLAITACNIRKLQLFKDHSECFLLTLHLPDAPQQVVALYLHGKWWHVNDVLRTMTKSRNSLEIVKSILERVLVLVLSQLVDTSLEEKQLFSNYSQTEKCKLLWTQGEAVGFYSFKLKAYVMEAETDTLNARVQMTEGNPLSTINNAQTIESLHKQSSMCDSCVSQCYELPVLDTIFVRCHCRKRGFGLRMLEDFCNMFPNEEVLGVSSPLSASMVAVCKKFLLQHKEHRDTLYEVEAPGNWIQRRNIWLNIQLGRYSQTLSSATLSDDVKNEQSQSSQKICNVIPGKTSPNCGGSQLPHTSNTHCGPPIPTEESQRLRMALKWKGQLPVDQNRKEKEETYNTPIKRHRLN